MSFNLFHSLFVDEILVFCKDSEDEILYERWILLCFEAISGIKVNMEKSTIIQIALVGKVDVLAKELGCKVGSLPASYFPLGLHSMPFWCGKGLK